MQRLLHASPRTVRNAAYSLRTLTQSAPPLKSQFSDPYPLPLSSETLAAQTRAAGEQAEQADPEEQLPARLPRSNESVQTLRARLIYQSRKRGTLESDLLLSTFASENIKCMTEEELKEFDSLMDEPDWDIYYWAVDKKAPPERWAKSPLLAKLRKHAANEGKVVRRMPDLAKTR